MSRMLGDGGFLVDSLAVRPKVTNLYMTICFRCSRSVHEALIVTIFDVRSVLQAPLGCILHLCNDLAVLSEIFSDHNHLQTVMIYARRCTTLNATNFSCSL